MSRARYDSIYHEGAALYDRFVSREDWQGHLLQEIQAILPLDGLDVVEMGAGTGRITRLLLPHVATIQAFDASADMIDVARRSLSEEAHTHWSVGVADYREMPTPDACADLVIEGWSVGHLVGWCPDDWRAQVRRVMNEMKRILKPGGTGVLIETLGSGTTEPCPPNAGLAALYKMWVEEFGCTHRWCRTDYRFDSLEEAVRLCRFFFGDAMADRVDTNQWQILPECTGLWYFRC